MSNNVSSQDLTVTILVGIEGGALSGPLNTALVGIANAFKAAGSDSAGLAAKVGTSIAFLSVGTAIVTTQVGLSAVQITMVEEEMGSLLDFALSALYPSQPWPVSCGLNILEPSTISPHGATRNRQSFRMRLIVGSF